jgi:rRNA-processing protein Efg1
MAKQLKRQIEQATDPEERAVLESDLHIAEVDSHYARYFPFLEPYVSLYPIAKKIKESKADEEDEAADEKSLAKIALRAPRPEMWAVVEKAMEAGKEALEKLRDRRTDVEVAAKPQKKSFKETGRAARREEARNKAASGGNSLQLGAKGKGAEIAAKRQAAEEEDAGFFEEI